MASTRFARPHVKRGKPSCTASRSAARRAWPLALVALAFAAASLKANERMAEYKAWKRAWDAMGGTPTRSHGWKWVGTVLVALGATYLAGTADTPLSHGIIGLLLAGLAGLAVLVVIGKLWRAVARRKPARMVPVAIRCKPTLPVPALRAAYAALPDYCLRLMAGR